MSCLCLLFSSRFGDTQRNSRGEKTSGIWLPCRRRHLFLAMGKGSFLQALFRSVKSMHILILPFFFGTSTTFASHSEYLTSLMTFASSNLCTSVFAARILSSDIFLCFCFLGLMFSLISSSCCIMSLLTPSVGRRRTRRRCLCFLLEFS